MPSRAIEWQPDLAKGKMGVGRLTSLSARLGERRYDWAFRFRIEASKLELMFQLVLAGLELGDR